MRPICNFAAISANAALVSKACARDSSVFGPTMNTSGRSLPSVRSPTETWRGCMVLSATLKCHCGLHQPRLVEGGLDERGEQRVRLEGLGFQLGMELHADKPGVVGDFDNLRQQAVGRHPGKAQPGLLERVAV